MCVDGRSASSQSGRAGSCTHCYQRCCAHFASWTAGPEQASCVVLVHGAHRCRQGNILSFHPSVDFTDMYVVLEKTELCKALAAFLFNDEQRGL